MTFDAWYHVVVGIAFGWFACAFVLLHGWKISARVSALAYRITNRCSFCGRSFLRCWRNNTCEGRQVEQKRWEVHARRVIMPQVGLLGQLLLDVSAAETMREHGVQTPDLSGDIKPPNG